MLCENSLVTLLKCALRPDAKSLRFKLVCRPISLDSKLRQRIFAELENEAIVALLEFYTIEFLALMKTSEHLVENVWVLTDFYV